MTITTDVLTIPLFKVKPPTWVLDAPLFPSNIIFFSASTGSFPSAWKYIIISVSQTIRTRKYDPQALIYLLSFTAKLPETGLSVCYLPVGLSTRCSLLHLYGNWSCQYSQGHCSIQRSFLRFCLTWILENLNIVFSWNTFYPWLPLHTLFWCSDLTGCSFSSFSGSSDFICYSLLLLDSVQPLWANLLFMECDKVLLPLAGTFLAKSAEWWAPLDLLKYPLLGEVIPRHPILDFKPPLFYFSLCLIFLHHTFQHLTKYMCYAFIYLLFPLMEYKLLREVHYSVWCLGQHLSNRVGI